MRQAIKYYTVANSVTKPTITANNKGHQAYVEKKWYLL